MVPNGWPLATAWLGTSVEDQRTADERLPELLATPAAHRWLSVEPLLEPVDLSPWLRPGRRWQCGACRRYCREWVNKWSNDCPHCGRVGYLCGSHAGNGAEGNALDWVVVGAESGPGAPPSRVEWVRSVVEQCRAAGVSVWVKQLAREDGGADMNRWPVDVRARETT